MNVVALTWDVMEEREGLTYPETFLTGVKKTGMLLDKETRWKGSLHLRRSGFTRETL